MLRNLFRRPNRRGHFRRPRQVKRCPLSERVLPREMMDASAPAILQIFDSSDQNLEKRAADIFIAGYVGIWIPPTGRADSGNFPVGYDAYNRLDPDGQPNAMSLGDDSDEVDDENGVVGIADLLPGGASTLTVSVSENAKLDAWIDFNGDGDFDHPDEHLGAGTSIDVIA